MTVRYAHTNIVAQDWDTLARFYETVLECRRLEPERNQMGDWLEKGTGVPGAVLRGVHLRLPGYGENGPTLEIFSYTAMLEKPEPAANRQGFGHLAFAVEDVGETLRKVLAHGGRALGEIVTTDVPGAGRVTFVYTTDPEGNILELQRWGW